MHEVYWRLIDERPWIWSSFVWNMFDFLSAIATRAAPRAFNMKGLVTCDFAPSGMTRSPVVQGQLVR